MIEREGPAYVVPKVINLYADVPQKVVFSNKNKNNVNNNNNLDKDKEKFIFFEIQMFRNSQNNNNNDKKNAKSRSTDTSIEVHLVPIKGKFVLLITPIFDNNDTVYSHNP